MSAAITPTAAALIADASAELIETAQTLLAQIRANNATADPELLLLRGPLLRFKLLGEIVDECVQQHGEWTTDQMAELLGSATSAKAAPAAMSDSDDPDPGRCTWQLAALTDFIYANTGGLTTSIEEIDRGGQQALMSIVADLAKRAHALQGGAA